MYVLCLIPPMHHVLAEVCNEGDVPIWAAVGVYGWPEGVNKHHTWALMRDIRSSTSLCTIFFGDFNEIIYASEKDGGANRRDCMIDAFREAVELCDIHDLGFHGSSFTWRCGNDLNTIIRERLDRFLACDELGGGGSFPSCLGPQFSHISFRPCSNSFVYSR